MKTYLTKLMVIIVTLLVVCPATAAKKDKEDEGRIEATVWFKDGRVYKGELPKHWLTYRQTFINPGHNFHIISPDNPAKTVKCEASDVDSIQITASTHKSFTEGDFYLPAPKISFKKGKYKLIRRISSGRNVDFCKMPSIGNCVVHGMNLDQRVEIWYLRFKKTGEVVSFFINPLQDGCQGPMFDPSNLAGRVKKTNPGLSESVMQRFTSKDKETHKGYAKEVMDNPQLFVDFVDDYLSGHPEE